jgi:hypothetical protein
MKEASRIDLLFGDFRVLGLYSVCPVSIRHLFYYFLVWHSNSIAFKLCFLKILLSGMEIYHFNFITMLYQFKVPYSAEQNRY